MIAWNEIVDWMRGEKGWGWKLRLWENAAVIIAIFELGNMYVKCTCHDRNPPYIKSVLGRLL